MAAPSASDVSVTGEDSGGTASPQNAKLSAVATADAPIGQTTTATTNVSTPTNSTTPVVPSSSEPAAKKPAAGFGGFKFKPMAGAASAAPVPTGITPAPVKIFGAKPAAAAPGATAAPTASPITMKFKPTATTTAADPKAATLDVTASFNAVHLKVHGPDTGDHYVHDIAQPRAQFTYVGSQQRAARIAAAAAADGAATGAFALWMEKFQALLHSHVEHRCYKSWTQALVSDGRMTAPDEAGFFARLHDLLNADKEAVLSLIELSGDDSKSILGGYELFILLSDKRERFISEVLRALVATNEERAAALTLRMGTAAAAHLQPAGERACRFILADLILIPPHLWRIEDALLMDIARAHTTAVINVAAALNAWAAAADISIQHRVNALRLKIAVYVTEHADVLLYHAPFVLDGINALAAHMQLHPQHAFDVPSILSVLRMLGHTSTRIAKERLAPLRLISVIIQWHPPTGAASSDVAWDDTWLAARGALRSSVLQGLLREHGVVRAVEIIQFYPQDHPADEAFVGQLLEALLRPYICLAAVGEYESDMPVSPLPVDSFEKLASFLLGKDPTREDPPPIVTAIAYLEFIAACTSGQLGVDPAAWAAVRQAPVKSRELVEAALRTQFATAPPPPIVRRALHALYYDAETIPGMHQAVTIDDRPLLRCLISLSPLSTLTQGYSRAMPSGLQRSPFVHGLILREAATGSILTFMVKELFSDADLNTPIPNVEENNKAVKKSPLTLSIQYDHLEIAMVLLDRGADPNTTQDADAMTEARSPLHMAVLARNCPAVVMLITRGAIAENPQIPGITPLMLAIIHQQGAIVDVLVEKGAHTVEMPGTVKQSSFGESIIKGSRTIHPNHIAGILPAIIRSQLAPFHKMELVRKLLARGENIEGGVNMRDTAMCAATQTCNLPMVTLLLNHGAVIQPFLPTERMPKPVDDAAVRILELLFRHGWEVPVEAQLLYIQSDAMIQTMLDHGARVWMYVDTRGFQGREVFPDLLLSSRGDPRAVKRACLLRDYGAPPISKFFAPRSNITEMTDRHAFDTVSNYVPTPRKPAAVQVFEAQGKRTIYLPWSAAIHTDTPIEFRRATRGVLLLRLTTAGEGFDTLPWELIEIFIDHLYQYWRKLRYARWYAFDIVGSQ